MLDECLGGPLLQGLALARRPPISGDQRAQLWKLIRLIGMSAGWADPSRRPASAVRRNDLCLAFTDPTATYGPARNIYFCLAPGSLGGFYGFPRASW